MKHVCLVFGGLGSEKEVSFSSSRSCLKALQSLGYKVTELEFDESFVQNILNIKPDIVFNAMHGTYGEDGTIQTLLNFLKIPYTHSGRQASITCMNKELTKQIASSLEIPIISSYIATKEQLLEGSFKRFRKSFIKPVSEGSTVGCVRLFEENLSEDDTKIINSVSGNFFLVEEFFEGTEISVAIALEKVIGGVEIAPKNGYYNYASKYTKGATDYYIPPRISKEVLKKMEEATFLIYKTIGLKGVSRADFLLQGEDVRFLEINTHPGFTETSLVPKIAQNIGITFEDLIKFLVEKADFESYS